jgi:hypothetical protein
VLEEKDTSDVWLSRKFLACLVPSSGYPHRNEYHHRNNGKQTAISPLSIAGEM